MREIGRLHVLVGSARPIPGQAPASPARSTLEIARLAIQGGADVIQLREKGASTREWIETGRALVALAREHDVRLIVNDRVDVAIACDAHGVHLGRHDLPILLAREMLGPDRVIGGSANSIEEAIAAERAGADYVGIGPVRPTSSKEDAGDLVPLDDLRALVAKLEIPIIAIGGIGPESAAEIMGTGVRGLAVIHAVNDAPDPTAATAGLRAIMERVLEERRYPW